MAEPKWLKDMNPDEYLKEDFEAKGKSKYTVEGIVKMILNGWIRQLRRSMLQKVTIM